MAWNYWFAVVFVRDQVVSDGWRSRVYRPVLYIQFNSGLEDCHRPPLLRLQYLLYLPLEPKTRIRSKRHERRRSFQLPVIRSRSMHASSMIDIQHSIPYINTQQTVRCFVPRLMRTTSSATYPCRLKRVTRQHQWWRYSSHWTRQINGCLTVPTRSRKYAKAASQSRCCGDR